MAEGQILESKSWEKGGEEARQKHLTAVMENAGLEVVKEDEAVPEPEPEVKNLTPDEHIRRYGEQAKAAQTKYPDWEKTVKQDIFIGREVQAAIIQQENGADVVYYLGQHPKYAASLGKKSPIEAVAEVGRLSSRLRGDTPHAPQGRFVRPAENASFEEIVKAPNYYGKARDIRRALRRR